MGIPKQELTERLKQSGLAADHPRLPALLHLYNAVRSLPRHLGQHSGGMIICDRGLDSVVPLENASMPGRTVVQWDKDDCEDLGIIKVDLLGLGMMAAIQDTLTLCNSRPGREVDIAQLPKDDPETYAMIQRADTIGVFQIESRAQMATLPRLKPRNFYDICVEVAIIRPGPIVGGLVHPYIDRRNGREPITYIHESFRPILRRTLGIPLFQEQVLQMAMVIADFTGSQAEELRRAISFKRSDERMQRVMQKLRAGMEKMKIPTNTQEEVVKAISLLRPLRLPREPRHQLRAARLRQLLAQGPPPGRILHRAAQQPADGLLLPRHPAARCQAPRHPDTPGLRQRLRLRYHRRGRHHPAPRACAW